VSRENDSLESCSREKDVAPIICEITIPVALMNWSFSSEIFDGVAKVPELKILTKLEIFFEVWIW